MNAPGHRLQWADLPAALRAEIEAVLDSTVVDAVNQQGGYGPSLAARCALADGRRVFIKSVSSAQNPDSPRMTRREARIAECLPASAPAPALLHTLDDGDWITLVFEEVDGRHPREPWDAEELDRVFAAMRALGDMRPTRKLRTVAEQYGAMFTGWRALADDEPDRVADAWCRAHVHELAAAEARWEQVSVGAGVIHGDVRSDNVLFTRDDDVVFVDWTSTCTAASWFEVLLMLPSVALEGGGEPEAVLARAGIGGLDRDVQLPVVAALAGYFANNGRLPDPPGLPTLRSFQRAQGEVANAWLRRLWERSA
jgi:aminoglycoside phosphotransferase (APT) family kinase protein